IPWADDEQEIQRPGYQENQQEVHSCEAHPDKSADEQYAEHHALDRCPSKFDYAGRDDTENGWLEDVERVFYRGKPALFDVQPAQPIHHDGPGKNERPARRHARQYPSLDITDI